MVKPSIFSKDYERKMRRRKNRIKITIFISILVIIFVAASANGIFKSISKRTNKIKESITSSKGEVKNTNNANNAKNNDAKNSKSSTENKEKKPEQYTVQMSNGTNINVVYESKNNDKVFKDISPKESNVPYSISPSGKNIVLFDNKAQSIILLDTNGNKQDITNPQYTATNGDVITKDSMLSQQPNYIWCSSPVFIDDNNVAYISQLPWIGRTTKYIWIENIKDRTYSFVQEIQGEDLKLDKLTDKGLTVVADGKTVFLTADGHTTE